MKKLQMKIDSILWAFIWLVPFFAFFVSWYRIGNAPNVLTFMDSFQWSFIADIINNVWQTAFNTACPIANYLSYLVMVQVAHCLFDVIVFIPRFAHNLIEWSTTIWQKD